MEALPYDAYICWCDRYSFGDAVDVTISSRVPLRNPRSELSQRDREETRIKLQEDLEDDNRGLARRFNATAVNASVGGVHGDAYEFENEMWNYEDTVLVYYDLSFAATTNNNPTSDDSDVEETQSQWNRRIDAEKEAYYGRYELDGEKPAFSSYLGEYTDPTIKIWSKRSQLLPQQLLIKRLWTGKAGRIVLDCSSKDQIDTRFLLLWNWMQGWMGEGGAINCYRNSSSSRYFGGEIMDRRCHNWSSFRWTALLVDLLPDIST